jgi:hypothetical protein
MQQWVLNAPTNHFWFFVSAGGLSAVAAFVYAFILLRRMRIMDNTPTSKIRSAAQGYVELEGYGDLMEGDAIVGPLTTKPCTWYRYKVEKLGEKHSRVVESGVSDELFVLVGDTGRCVIDPEGATVISRHKEVWYESGYPSRRTGRRHGTGMLGMLFSGGRYRYTEERMHPGETLYALGWFHSVGGGNESFNTDAEVRELLKQWKQNKAALLKHFDANGDGEIDAEEWETVRKAAYAKVRREQVERSTAPPTHMMIKPPHDKHPYLLSVHPQHELLKRYRWMAGGSLAWFFGAGGFAVWALTIRLGTG